VPPPALTVAKYEYPEGEIAVVEVLPSFQTPVRFDGKVCIRVGPRKGIANEAEERILSEKRSSYAKTFDTTPAYGSNIDDIGLDLFKITYLPQAIDKDTLDANHREIKGQLSSLKFYHLLADCPTNAGILMFGKNPRFYLPGAYIQYVRFTGNDEISDFDFEHTFSGDLTTQMRVLDEFINSQIIKTKAVSEQGTLKESYISNYPPRALRELMYNAIIHRDYQSNAPIKFYEFSDRIEITNPGGLYGDARPENFPNKNDYRNPSLAEASKNLGYVNSFNVGVKRAIAQLKLNGNPDPKFIIDQATSFGVTMYKRLDV